MNSPTDDVRAFEAHATDADLDDLRARLAAAGPAAYLPDLPVVGLWPIDANTTLRTMLHGDGSRSVRAFADWIGAEPVTGAGEIANVNTPGDLARISAQRD